MTFIKTSVLRASMLGVQTLLLRGTPRLFSAALVIALVAIVVGSLDPRLAPPEHMHADKILHVLAYGTASGLAVLATARPMVVALILLGIVLQGGLIEIAQSFVPGRSAGIDDFVANLAGVLIGATMGYLVVLWRRRSLGRQMALAVRIVPDEN